MPEKYVSLMCDAKIMCYDFMVDEIQQQQTPKQDNNEVKTHESLLNTRSLVSTDLPSWTGRLISHIEHRRFPRTANGDQRTTLCCSLFDDDDIIARFKRKIPLMVCLRMEKCSTWQCTTQKQRAQSVLTWFWGHPKLACTEARYSVTFPSHAAPSLPSSSFRRTNV